MKVARRVRVPLGTSLPERRAPAESSSPGGLNLKLLADASRLVPNMKPEGPPQAVL